jgi:YHS domain-containing protein
MDRDFTVTAESLRSEYQGRTYVFCCPPCKARFDANPAEFARPAS